MKRRLAASLEGIIGPLNLVRQIEWREILRRLSPSRGDEILDAACGSGLLSVKIARTGANISGIDLSSQALRQATFTANTLRVSCGFSRQDADSLAFPENTFDKVVSSSALEHFEHDDLALREMARVLKPGGILVLTCDSLMLPMGGRMKELHRRRASVVRYYTKERIMKQMELAGLQVVRAEYLLKTRLTNVFYQTGITLSWNGFLWVGISLLATPVCLLSEASSGEKESGQTVIVLAQKRSSVLRAGIRG